jgi:uncharacterized protein
MRLLDTGLRLTATDLSNFLGCRVRTALEMAEAGGGAKRPWFDDPLREILFARGVDHEKTYVALLRAAGRQVVEIAETTNAEAALAATAAAMRAGADVIVQAALRDRHWYGRADILDKVAAHSALGPWSYEIVDTKLARETRAGTILQLGLYSAMLETAQGARPEFFHVVTPGPVHHRYRTNAHAAYFRWVRTRMEDVVARGHEAVAGAVYPEPVDHCDICPWHSGCNTRWHADDHLSIVAGITRHQRHELVAREVGTLAALARLPIPLEFKPRRGSADTYVRVREQARLQLESRGRLWPLHELRACEEGKGLARLPEPSPGDIFLDLEGDSFAREGGREYLFGLVTVGPGGAPVYRGYWAFDDAQERAAFEAVMDVIAEAKAAYPGMHVYHYAPYEPSAFKRLMGRYATRGDALDAMLREGRFVDLYGVVRQGLLAGIERYSIKNLEVFYGYERDIALRDAGRALRRMEQALELSCPDAAPPEVRDLVEGYNRDDCVSTLRLRDWLEGQRAGLVASGTAVPRPVVVEGAPPEKVDERARRVAALRERLLDGIPEAAAERNAEQQARWTLAYLLDWHRREDKAGWWEFYRLRDLPEEDLFDEPQAVAGLHAVTRVREVVSKTGKVTGSVVDRYRYPAQDMEIREGDELKIADGKKYADVSRVDRKTMTIDVQKGKTKADVHATAAFVHNHVNTGVLEEAIDRIAGTIAAAGRVSADDDGGAPLAGALLLAARPRLRTGSFVMGPEETAVDFAVRAVSDLDRTVLAIQGPPGSGKTYSGARMICALIAQGRTVGITATGHKVIRNLLEAVSKEAARCGAVVRLAQKTEDDGLSAASAGITILDDNAQALSALQSGTANVVGGTAWLWARPEMQGAVDVLFVDEAGQMSLANVLAVTGAAGSIVLLGDPQQLDQPQKGTHPDGVGASALEHILGGLRTVPADRGIFLPETWRLAPSVCAFTSEVFYDGKLRSRPGLEAQELRGNGEFEGSGLWFVDVAHDGNRNFSVEEVDRVAAIVTRLTAPGSHWIDRDGVAAQMTGADVLVVSPYNAQVVRLIERLEGTGAQVGTVDKFQGREAPVVLYSMATSRPEDAPRGMEFLYSLNRLNVATSRARCAAIVVASPLLVEPECRTPRQMELANALCRFREMARR